MSTHFRTVSPLSKFSIDQPLFLQKTKSLYPNPKYLFGIGIGIWAAKNQGFSLRVSVVRGSRQGQSQMAYQDKNFPGNALSNSPTKEKRDRGVKTAFSEKLCIISRSRGRRWCILKNSQKNREILLFCLHKLPAKIYSFFYNIRL